MSTTTPKHFIDFSEIQEKDSAVREAYCKTFGGYVHYKEIPAGDYISLVEKIDSEETEQNDKAALLVELLHARLCNEDGSEFASVEKIARLSLRALSKLNEEINEARDKGGKKGNG
jgi:hypothetical protein